jgi:ligand-binding sensor domain-containing protein
MFMRRKNLLIVVFIAAWTASLYAQKEVYIIEPHPLMPGYQAATNIHDIAFHSGLIWVAIDVSNDGALKYNGVDWTSIPVAKHVHHVDEGCDTIEGIIADHSACITVDYLNNIWIGSISHGISKRLSDTDTIWATYTKNCGLAGDIIRKIITVKDTVWVATKSGLTRIIGNTNFKTYRNELPDTNIMCLAIDKSKNIWVGTVAGLSKFNGISWKMEYPVTGGKNHINAITVEDNGNVWVSVHQSGQADKTGLYMYNGSSWTKKSDEEFFHLAFDKKGHLWAATLRDGVKNFNGNFWTQYTTEDGLFHNKIGSIAVDSSGAVWIGCFGGLTKIYDTTTQPQLVIQNFKNENEFISIFPNPTTGKLRIIGHSMFDMRLSDIKIYDIDGKLQTVENRISENEIDISHLAPGIYFLRIDRKTVKIVKQ